MMMETEITFGQSLLIFLSIFIPIGILIAITFLWIGKQTTKFYKKADELQTFLESIDELNKENYNKFLKMAREVNKLAFHRVHAQKIMEIKGYIKGKFNIKV